MRLQRCQPRASLRHRPAIEMRRMHAHEQALPASVGMHAHQRMAHRRRIGDLLRRCGAAVLLLRQLPAMDHAHAVQFRLLRIAQRFIGGIHVGEAGIAAIRRHGDRVQDGGERRFRTKRLVGVPFLRADLAAGLAVGAEVGDRVHQRIVAAAVARDVALQRAELLGEGDLLVLAQAAGRGSTAPDSARRRHRPRVAVAASSGCDRSSPITSAPSTGDSGRTSNSSGRPSPSTLPRPCIERPCYRTGVTRQQQQQQAAGTDDQAVIRERVQRPGIVLAEVAHQEPGAGIGGDAGHHRSQRRQTEGAGRHALVQQLSAPPGPWRRG